MEGFTPGHLSKITRWIQCLDGKILRLVALPTHNTCQITLKKIVILMVALDLVAIVTWTISINLLIVYYRSNCLVQCLHLFWYLCCPPCTQHFAFPYCIFCYLYYSPLLRGAFVPDHAMLKILPVSSAPLLDLLCSHGIVAWHFSLGGLLLWPTT